MTEIRGYEVNLDILEGYLSKGLSPGVGRADGQVCVEAALCLSLGLPIGDDPPCTDPSVRTYKIRLNDAVWSSPEARTRGMRGLAYAQIGTRGKIDPRRWVKRLAELTIQELLSDLLDRLGFAQEAKRCREEGTREAAEAAEDYVYAAAYAADAADAAAAAADTAKWSTRTVHSLPQDHYLLLSASLALRALEEQGFGVPEGIKLETE